MRVGSQRNRWWPVLAQARPWSPPARRTVVVTPHPDDESLSSGGLIAFQRARGVEVIVVAVTDGEASHDPAGDCVLAEVRRAEQEAAVALLGVEPRCIQRLGLPDSRVSEFEAELCTRLVDLLGPEDLVVATSSRDVHPDHEACGRAAFRATRMVPATLVFSLFWTWHHRPVDEVDGSKLVAFEPPVAAHAAKQRAIRQHMSQFEHNDGQTPILDDIIVEPACWPCEFFLEASDRTAVFETSRCRS